MMDLRQIEYESRKAARESAKQHVEPLVIWPKDIDDAKANVKSAINQLPFIGDRCPKGWKRVRMDEKFDANRHGIYMGDNHGYGAYLVDASGFGRDDESALTFGGLVKRLKVNYGYAIVEAGQFQVKIAAFEHSTPAVKRWSGEKVLSESVT